jgi:hypothetical protein
LAVTRGVKLILICASFGCTNQHTSANLSKSADSSKPTAAVEPVDSVAPTSQPSVRLIDFGFHGIESDSVAKLEVTIGATVDTVPGLFTSLTPVITNDGMIHGISMAANGTATHGYDYNPRTKKLTLFPLPSDLNGSFHEIEISSDAKFVAYVAHVESGETWAVVRSWPNLSSVTRTPASQGFPSDVGYDEVKWLGQDRFHISYRISSGPSIVVEGDPLTRAIKVDTIPAPVSQ